MKLLKIKLENFKGLRDFTLDTRGESVSVYGANGVGKSTIADGFYYCLFGKDSRGQADFDIKTLNADGEPIHNLNHSVTVEFDSVTFSRTYHEVYQAKRGSHNKEMTGHTTDYAVDGVPLDKRAYDARVAEICPEGTFRLLTDPTHFASLPWQKRREMLMKAFAGDITDDIVIRYSPALAKLPEILGKYSVDEYRKIADNRRKAINEDLRTIPAVINEFSRKLAQPLPAQQSRLDVIALRDALQKAERSRAELLAGAGGAQIATEIAKVETTIERWKAARRREFEEAQQAARADRHARQNAAADARQQVINLQRQYDADQQEHTRMGERLEEMRAEMRKLKEEQWPEAAIACKTCGQPLPAERVEQAKAQFNEALARKKDENRTAGTTLKAQFEAMGHSLETLCGQIEQAQATADQLQRDVNVLPAEAEFVLDTSAPDYGVLVEKLNRLQKQQADAEAGGDTSEIDAKIAQLQTDIRTAEESAAARAARADDEARVKQLTEDESRLQSEAETLLYNLSLVDEFVRAKVNLVSERINGQFAMAKFKLFDVQMNGGIAECCDVMHGGVPWDSLNTAARTNTGLDIINTLAKELCADESAVPCLFIDGAESVTDIIPTIGQQIRLIVSADDTTLRVEYGATTTTAAEATDQKELF